MPAPRSSTARKEAPLRSSASPMGAAVIGYGQFGRYHAAKYELLPNVRLAAIVDTDPVRRDLARRDFPQVCVYAAVDELLAAAPPALASVVVPASQHFAVARELLGAGTHLLVEKPLAASLPQAWELLQLAQQRHLIVQPGHLERFHHYADDLRRHCPTPVAMETRRLARWSGRGGDVDVVMELMIHDIDLVMELIDAPLVDVEARGTKLLTAFWDVAEARLRFADGCEVTLSASRAATHNERHLHLAGASTCARLDALAGKLVLSTLDNDAVNGETLAFSRGDALAAEIEEFVGAVREQRPPCVSILDGYRAMETAQRIIDVMEEDYHLPQRIHRGAPKTTANDYRHAGVRRADHATAILE